MTDIETNVNSISISELRKSHRSVEVLHGVSFTAAPGEVTAFLGPNGAGKSSTLRILLGLDRADSGSALFGGKRYRDIDRPLTRVGALFDGLAGNKMRSVASHLAIVAESNGIPHARVSQVLEEVGLSAKRKSRLGTLSLGEGQRLGLALALLGEPQFLVLDEPTNGLDPAGIRWFRNFVKGQAALGRTVLLSSHVLSEVQAVADRAVVISKGSILLDSPLAEATEKISSLEDLFFELTEGVA